MLANSVRLFFVFATAAGLLLYSVGNCQILKGRITDEKDKAINHAHIQILRDGKIRNRTYSNKKGTYQMWPVDPGYYQALVSVVGYDRVIRNIDLKSRDSNIVDFSLHKTSGLLSK